LSIKVNIPLGEEIAALRSSSYCGIPFCRHIGGRLLVAGIGTGPVAWERCLRADRKKRGGTCHCLRTAPYLALLWLALYNTGVQTLFPLRKHIIWNFLWPCFGGMHIFLYCLGNNGPGRVYCPRAQRREHLPRAGVVTCFRTWARKSLLSFKQRVVLLRTIPGRALA